MNTATNVEEDLRKRGNQTKAKASAWFFKTGPGQYGEGDIFIGVTLPEIRYVARAYKDLPLSELQKLLKSPVHEFRLISLIIEALQFAKADDKKRKELYKFYLKNTKFINNWDLVDTSAEQIVGKYLLDKPTDILQKLAKSQSIWERRISIISTFSFIKTGRYEETFKIAQTLLFDKEDLIQKAVGWMLREVGKRCGKEYLIEFLKDRYKGMPRTMLRYAIEHFPQEVRQKYLKGLI